MSGMAWFSSLILLTPQSWLRHDGNPVYANIMRASPLLLCLHVLAHESEPKRPNVDRSRTLPLSTLKVATWRSKMREAAMAAFANSWRRE
jgi:hypothetical protein